MKGKVLLAALLLPLWVWSQTSGEIKYEDKRNLHKRFTQEQEHLKEFVPQFRSHNMILRFSDSEALYAPDATDEIDPEQMEAGGRRMHFRQMRSEHKRYVNYKTGERVEQRGFMDKNFLISGEVEKYAWKMTAETKQVGQYLCHKSTYSDSLTNITAWFTMQIPVPLGPSYYGQLPGLILHVDINNGERTITAQEINLSNTTFGSIEKPSKGKEISQEEFDKIVQEKMKEMGGNRGGRMHFMRRN